MKKGNPIRRKHRFPRFLPSWIGPGTDIEFILVRRAKERIQTRVVIQKSNSNGRSFNQECVRLVTLGSSLGSLMFLRLSLTSWSGKFQLTKQADSRWSEPFGSHYCGRPGSGTIRCTILCLGREKSNITLSQNNVLECSLLCRVLRK